jgi:hypothetical protein
MKSFLSAVALLALAGLTSAQTPAPGAAAASGPSAQQSKMGQCNKDAADKKGDERKAFMKECLSAKEAAKTTQQDKMKTCNADAKAKALKGDERKAFMKECLSK